MENQIITQRIKRCPFCGGKAKVLAEREKCFFVICMVCGARKPNRPTEAAAIETWNRRYDDAKAL